MEDYDDWGDEDEDESVGLILSCGDDGKPEIHTAEDYTQMLNTNFELIKGFIEKNKKAFDEYCQEAKNE